MRKKCGSTVFFHFLDKQNILGSDGARKRNEANHFAIRVLPVSKLKKRWERVGEVASSSLYPLQGAGEVNLISFCPMEF